MIEKVFVIGLLSLFKDFHDPQISARTSPSQIPVVYISDISQAQTEMASPSVLLQYSRCSGNKFGPSPVLALI